MWNNENILLTFLLFNENILYINRETAKVHITRKWNWKGIKMLFKSSNFFPVEENLLAKFEYFSRTFIWEWRKGWEWLTRAVKLLVNDFHVDDGEKSFVFDENLFEFFSMKEKLENSLWVFYKRTQYKRGIKYIFTLIWWKWSEIIL